MASFPHVLEHARLLALLGLGAGSMTGVAAHFAGWVVVPLPWTVGLGLLSITAAFVPRRWPAIRLASAVIVAAVAAFAGLPGHGLFTFPWISIARASSPPFFEPFVAMGLVLIATAPDPQGPSIWLRRSMGPIGCLLLAIILLLPAKFDIQTITPQRPGMVTVPTLAWSAPEQHAWSQGPVSGNAITCMKELLGGEWALMDLAGGIHQERALADLAAGTGNPAWIAVQGAIRWTTWRALEGVVALILLGRVFCLPFAVWGLARPFLRRTAAPHPSRGPGRLAWALLLAAPGANLTALAITSAFLLPDDLALRPAAYVGTLGWLAALCGVACSSADEETP